ncbi:MAG: hypothetical protein EBU50_03985 [Opitutae bacterium]|nr:hypothetical protein [Opitutae bacterium]
MIGQNNGGHNTAQEIAEGVTAVVQRVQAKCPKSKILLLAIFQRRPQITPERAVLDEANATVRSETKSGPKPSNPKSPNSSEISHYRH